MARITFQKRQKEMKRQEKQRMKAEKRAQRKIARNSESEAVVESSSTQIDQPEGSAASAHEYLEADGIEK